MGAGGGGGTHDFTRLSRWTVEHAIPGGWIIAPAGAIVDGSSVRSFLPKTAQTLFFLTYRCLVRLRAYSLISPPPSTFNPIIRTPPRHIFHLPPAGCESTWVRNLAMCLTTKYELLTSLKFSTAVRARCACLATTRAREVRINAGQCRKL